MGNWSLWEYKTNKVTLSDYNEYTQKDVMSIIHLDEMYGMPLT